MNFNFDFAKLKDKAMDIAQNAARKTKDLASVAKAKVSIAAEEDKIRKAQLELGKLYYRDYVLGEDMDSAEYLPWCDRITASRAVIEDLKDLIEEIRTGECAAPAEDDDFSDLDDIQVP